MTVMDIWEVQTYDNSNLIFTSNTLSNYFVIEQLSPKLSDTCSYNDRIGMSSNDAKYTHWMYIITTPNTSGPFY